MNARVTLETRRTSDGIERLWRVNGRTFSSAAELEKVTGRQ